MPQERKEDVPKRARGWITRGTCGGGERAETGQSRAVGMPFCRHAPPLLRILTVPSSDERPGCPVCSLMLRNLVSRSKASEWEGWAFHQAVRSWVCAFDHGTILLPSKLFQHLFQAPMPLCVAAGGWMTEGGA